MAGLSLRAKLALSHTSYSQRQLAAIMGLSPRTVGRWLREGDPEGVKKIPREARDLIDIAYGLHVDNAKAAAKEFEIPFTPDWPVNAVRKPLQKETRRTRQVIDPETGVINIVETRKRETRLDPKTGLPVYGDRIFIENAQFLGREIRQQVLLDFAETRKMVVASIGSRINLHRYYEQTLEERVREQRKSTKARKLSRKDLIRRINQSFEDTFGVAPKELVSSPEIRLVFTKKRTMDVENFGAYGVLENLDAAEDHIRQKHEGATGEPGTGVGNVLIVQMRRDERDKANARIAARQTPRNRRRRT